MPAQHHSQAASGITRDHVLWAALSLLVVAQIVAFWMLCSHQVHKAETRVPAAHTEQVAVVDFLNSPEPSRHRPTSGGQSN